VNEDSGHEERLYLLLVIHTPFGLRLGSDELCDRKLPGTKNPDRNSTLLKLVYEFADRIGTS